MSGSNWWLNTQPGPAAPGGTTVGGGGYGTNGISYRSPLDARRSMAGQESQWPDGYLGTITDRQQDKVLAKVQEKLTERSYQRGVHVGSKVGQDQYYWTPTVNPDCGLQRQAAAVLEGNVILTARFAPSGDPAERLAHMGKTAGLTPPEAMNLARQYGVDPGSGQPPSRLASMLPPWSV